MGRCQPPRVLNPKDITSWCPQEARCCTAEFRSPLWMGLGRFGVSRGRGASSRGLRRKLHSDMSGSCSVSKSPASPATMPIGTAWSTSAVSPTRSSAMPTASNPAKQQGITHPQEWCPWEPHEVWRAGCVNSQLRVPRARVRSPKRPIRKKITA